MQAGNARPYKRFRCILAVGAAIVPPVSVRCVPFFGRAMPAPTIAALHSESIRRISPCKADFI